MKHFLFILSLWIATTPYAQEHAGSDLQGLYFSFGAMPALKPGTPIVGSSSNDLNESIEETLLHNPAVFEDIEATVGYKEGPLRFEFGIRRANFNFTPPDGSSYFDGPINAPNIGPIGGLFYDFDLSDEEHDEIFYIGTTFGILRSRLGDHDDGILTNINGIIEAGILVGIGGSTDFKAAFELVRMGDFFYGSNATDGSSFWRKPYNRYVFKMGFVHFFTKNP